MFWSTHERNSHVDSVNGSGVQKTKFGYVFSGKYPAFPSFEHLAKDQSSDRSFMDKICPFTIPYEQNAYIAMTQSEKEIVEAIKEHFSFEDETDQNGGFTVNENKAIEMFNSSCRFDKREKKYVVSPLFRESPPQIQNNFHIASTMLKRLLRRLNNDPDQLEKYNRAFDEMVKRKEIERVKENLEQLSRPGRCINFLLHHAVPKKDGRDVRIVFNASRKGLDAKSLNDLLLVGPKLTKNLADIVVQNRTKNMLSSLTLNDCILPF